MNDQQEILSFRHPQAGSQIVKGTIEVNETPEQAVLRELAEESGITTATIISKLGVWQSQLDSHEWHFFLCDPKVELKDTWTFFTQDDGGHLFEFFWFDLSRNCDDSWHPLFFGVLEFIKEKLQNF